ncbi:MAG: manganese efflux pump [Oscillospiraceae bacterium]|nr:manganese efflux pump [Oscillospiraceae bacterium]
MVKIFLLVTAVCTDCFAAAVGIGSAGIKIPFRSSLIISSIGTLFLCISVGFAEIIRLVIPENICGIISSLLLILLGIFNLLQNYFKKVINQKQLDKSNPAALYFDGTAADTDNSKSISSREALMLSVALSADSLVTGVSAGLGKMNLPLLCGGALIAGVASISLGCCLGRKIVSSININLGWLCGAVLIILAFIK